MSLPLALSRINEIQSQLAGPVVPAPAPAAVPQPGAAPAITATDQTRFAQMLTQAQGAGAPPTAPLPGSVGERIVALARQELARGVRETSGNNDSPDIARYRIATKGAVAGAPWCAYFVSYIAREAGVPIGPDGSGMGYVPAIQTWAQQTGKYIPAGQGTPQPGDIIIFDNHIGIVEQVGPAGQVTTIEGNSSDAVARRENRQGAALGYLRLG